MDAWTRSATALLLEKFGNGALPPQATLALPYPYLATFQQGIYSLERTRMWHTGLFLGPVGIPPALLDRFRVIIAPRNQPHMLMMRRIILQGVCGQLQKATFSHTQTAMRGQRDHPHATVRWHAATS